MDFAPDFFDVLPLRTSPKRLESLTSYLIRLAEINDIRSPQGFSPILGVYVSTIQSVPDYPIRTLSEIASLASCRYEELLATTFSHLEWKFAGDMPRGTSTFRKLLNKNLSSCLRYCPACLADAAYYPLIWRFLALPGCAMHGCRLLDYCGHCGNPIQLFPFPPKIGVCPTCKGVLRSCSAPLLSEEEIQVVRLRVVDLEYLVSPLPSNDDVERVKRVGYRFAMLRRERGLSTQQVANFTGMLQHEVMRIEQGGIHQYASVQRYIEYADYLGISLRDIFEECAASDVVARDSPLRCDSRQGHQSFWQLHESLVFEHMQEVVRSLLVRGEKATASTVAIEMRTTSKVLRQYAAVDAFWQRVEADMREEREIERQRWKQERVQELVNQVESAASSLKSDGRALTPGAISKLVGVTLTTLYYYPQVRSLMERCCPRQKDQLGEDLVVEQTLAALAYLRSSGQIVSQTAISRLVGLSVTKLKAYSKLSFIMEQAKQEYYLQCEMRKKPKPEDESR